MTNIIDRDTLNKITDAANDAGQEVGRGWLRAASESGTSPDRDYSFENRADWETVRDAVRAAAGGEADAVWEATDPQPSSSLARAIWDAAESGYLLAIDA